MRGRVLRTLGILAAAVGLSAAAPKSVVAASGAPVSIDYQGVYQYQENATSGGKQVSTVGQTVSWSWHASGRLPVDSYSVENLPGALSVAGQETTTSAAAPATQCLYSAGAGASTSIRLSQHEFLEVGFGVGIPGAAAACGGGAPSSPLDVLACDLKTCDARICPAAPPAVSTERFQTPVLTAFQPTTSYLQTGYLPLADANGNFFGTVTARYDLPPASGVVRNTSCLNGVIESEQISITSSVTVTMLDGGGLHFNFQDPQFPELTPPIDPISMMPGGSGIPLILVPPKAPQPPDVTTPPPGPDPAVGVIEIRCPRRDRRCKGVVVVTGLVGAPRGALGHRTYSLAGGEDELLSVGLGSKARADLRRAGRFRVRVAVSSGVMPGARRSRGTRTVLVTASSPIAGVPSP